MPQPLLMVEPISALRDNYIWLFKTGLKSAAVVDPGKADPVLHILKRKGWTLTHIFLTHHHQDHIGGVEQLRSQFSTTVIGSKKDQERLPPLDISVEEGSELILGEDTIQIFDVPGHTLGHVAYYIKDALFAGDTLFSFGCGRLFEGTSEQMWKSLLKLRTLPDETRLYAAHEYTQTNLEFACSLEPNNNALQSKLKKIFRQTDADQPTLPTLLKNEKKYNPFLRADDATFAKNLGLSGKSPQTIFATIRRNRNHF